MDSITHIALGASIGEAVFGNKFGFKAALLGALLSSIPDFDVALYLFYDFYAMLSIHRGYSHSILICSLLAIFISFLLFHWKLFGESSFAKISFFAWTCFMSHLLLDTLTSYGTQLFLPFSNTRVGFDCINVVDPVYTIPLIIGLILCFWIYKTKTNRTKFVHWSIAISTIYLLLTFLNKQHIENIIQDHFDQADIKIQKLMTMPVGIANYNWYGVAKAKDSIYLQKYSLFEKEENPIEAFPIHEEYLIQLDKNVAEKMRWFAKGFYTVDTVNGKKRIYNLQVDMRGVVFDGNKKVPTVGYFEVEENNGKINFTSGSIKN
jgi:inner membrane protein